MKPITVWSIITDNDKIKHNHIENGWAKGDYPKPIADELTNQKAWEKLKWIRRIGYLDDQNRIVLN